MMPTMREMEAMLDFVEEQRKFTEIMPVWEDMKRSLSLEQRLDVEQQFISGVPHLVGKNIVFHFLKDAQGHWMPIRGYVN